MRAGSGKIVMRPLAFWLRGRRVVPAAQCRRAFDDGAAKTVVAAALRKAIRAAAPAPA